MDIKIYERKNNSKKRHPIEFQIEIPSAYDPYIPFSRRLKIKPLCINEGQKKLKYTDNPLEKEIQ